MKAKTFRDIFIYLLLLAPALLFVKNYVADYMDGDTIFVQMREDVTVDDIPTITICTGYTYHEYSNLTHGTMDLSNEYHKTIEISIKVAENGEITRQILTLEKNTKKFSDLTITLEQLQAEGDTSGSTIFIKKCFRVVVKSSQKRGRRKLNTTGFELWLHIKIPKPMPSLRHFTLSSEENSYGFVFERWFDGKVQREGLQSDHIDVQIDNVLEYHHLKSKCSQDSYYQLLADRFERFDTNMFLEQHFKLMCKSKNVYGGNYVNATCSPASLPFRNNKIPLCSLDIEKWCFQRVLERLMSDQTKHFYKTCRVKEFKIKQTPLGNHAEASVGNFVLWITYERSAEEISNSREWLTKTPFKTIKKEQYVISDMSLIGNIGGTLGMFVGFSFLAKTEWVLTKLEGLLRRFRNRIGVSEKTDVNSQF